MDGPPRKAKLWSSRESTCVDEFVHACGRGVATPVDSWFGSQMFEANVERLHAVARSVDEGRRDEAERALNALLAEVARAEDPRSVGLYVFGAAIARRLAGATAEQANLYLHQFDVPQIHLFNLLGRAVPFVGLATRLANDAIARAIAGVSHPTIVDVGIGTGRQVCVLIDDLSAQKALPARLTVIGIEPSDWALEEARRNVEQAAARASADVTFLPVLGAAESLTQGELRRMREACTSRPVINASFALHHIADDHGRDQRNDVLRRLRTLDPALLVLGEPDVDHLERRFFSRFRNCWAHFGAVFRTLDVLPLAQSDRNALKVGFFGREIADILSNPEDERSERHESASSWLARLTATGYEARVTGDLPALDTDAVRIVRRELHASIDAADVPVVSIIAAVPIGSADDAEEALARAPDSRAIAPAYERIEPEPYLAALAAVAAADELVHLGERAFIQQQAAFFGLPEPVAPSGADLDTLLARGRAWSRRTREAVVRDLVFLARIDGEYADEERAVISGIARALDLESELPRLERDATLPPEASGMPSWFVEQWYGSRK